MFGWMKRRKPAAVLHFKETVGAFEMECKFGGTKLAPGSVHLAIILQTDGEHAGIILGADDDANQLALVAVAETAGEFAAIAKTLQPLARPLREGDLVLWKAAAHMEAASAISGDARSAWLGLVVQRVRPSYDPANGWLTEVGSFAGQNL